MGVISFSALSLTGSACFACFYYNSLIKVSTV